MKRDADVERMLEEYSRSIEFTGKERVRERLEEAELGERTPRARTGRKVVIALVAVLALATATVFADDIVKVIRRVAFGRISAVQQDGQWLSEREDGGWVSTRMRVYGDSSDTICQEDIDAINEWYYTSVYDINEVRELFDFVREPAWLPDEYEFDHAYFMRYPSGKVSNSVILFYGIPRYKGFFQISIEQSVVGDDGTIEMQTVETIEQTKVGQADALLHITGAGGDIYHDYWWITGGVAYSVHGLSKLNIHKVAESIPIGRP